MKKVFLLPPGHRRHFLRLLDKRATVYCSGEIVSRSIVCLISRYAAEYDGSMHC